MRACFFCGFSRNVSFICGSLRFIKGFTHGHLLCLRILTHVTSFFGEIKMQDYVLCVACAGKKINSLYSPEHETKTARFL